MRERKQGGGIGGPNEATYTSGVDYVSAWIEADRAARLLNAATEQAGLDPRVTHAIAHAGANGEPVVWMRPDGARLIAALIECMAGYTSQQCVTECSS
ncbi:MAG TPA: hypothetical protein VIU15_03105 [Streptomyces sp.]